MSCPINASTTPAILAGRWLDTAEWPTGREVASAPYQLRQGTAGITGHCILTLYPRSAPALHCAPRSQPRKQHDMDSLARVITASKPARQINRSLRASALCTRVSAISGFVSAETPPRRYSLGTNRASASCTVSPQRLARSPPHPLRGSPRAPMMHRIGCDHHAQEQATGLGHAAPVGTTPYS